MYRWLPVCSPEEGGCEEEEEAMIVPKCCTNIVVKSENLPTFLVKVKTVAGTGRDTFSDLVKDQLEYGAKKYGLTATKESTDEITETYGVEWILGTCHKYLRRYQNLKRERDLLKVATYQFIAWLQMGYHLEPEDGAVERAAGRLNERADTFDTAVEYGLDRFRAFRYEPDESILLEVFVLMGSIWTMEGYAEAEEHDKDTWNGGNAE